MRLYFQELLTVFTTLG